MKKEYRINFDMPKPYNSGDILNKLPSPISSEEILLQKLLWR